MIKRQKNPQKALKSHLPQQIKIWSLSLIILTISFTHRNNFQKTSEGEELVSELQKRMRRERQLTVALEKLELKKNLALSKRSRRLQPKLVQSGENDQAAVYKWPYERKK